MTTTDKFITVYGQKIHYLEAGNGSVVILLHGLGSDASEWSDTIALLSKTHRVLAVDQVGFGQSDKPFINYRIGTLVDFLEGFCKQLKIERASLIGHSTGGAIAASFALAYPEQVERLVLVDSGYGYALPKVPDSRLLGHTPGTLKIINPATREDARQLLALVVYDEQTVNSDAAVDQLFEGAVRSGYANQRFVESFARREDVLDDRLQAIKQPTLIVWGREDGINSLELGQRFNQEIPGSELVVIDKCGHNPNVEQPAEFNAAVLRFLGST